MKILLLTNKSPWPAHDGGSSALVSMVHCLSSLKAQITILSLNTLKHYADEKCVTGEIPSGTELHLVTHDSGINVPELVSNLLFSSMPYLTERFESSVLRIKLDRLLETKYDFIQVEGLAMMRYIGQIRKRSGAPVIFRPHNIESMIWKELAKEEKNILRKIYYSILASRMQNLETGIMNKADGLVTISKNDNEWFIASGLTIPSVTIPPSPYKNLLSRGSKEENSVFYIGALDWRPNLNGLKWFIDEVWPQVHSLKPESHFHIAGRNPSAGMKFIHRAPNTFFHGEVTESAEFIMDHSVMIVPLSSGSGTRVKIIEGMSLGKCIVATTVAAKGVICEKGRNILIADTPQEFASAVLSVLCNKQLKEELSVSAIENVRKNYDIFADSIALNDFYSSLIK